jgi:hypothetical protein
MKRIVLLVALFALGLFAASFAVAKPPPGKGKDKGSSTTSSTALDPQTCRPKISVILKGEFVAASVDSFTMNVRHANLHGRALAGATLTLRVDAKTSYKRNGPAKLTDFKAGDRLNVQARACKASKTAGSDSTAGAPAMLAKRVTGHPAKASDSQSDAGESGTTATP